MSHEITDKTKLQSFAVYGNQLTLHTAIRTALQALSNGDKIVDISVVRKSVGNNFMAIISVEQA